MWDLPKVSSASHLRPVLLDPSSVGGVTVSLLAHAVGAAIPTIQMLHQLMLVGARMWVV
uniref:Gaba(A) receptor-associated protein n=1 Tax=Solanum tuberosum TaxID=4113 RepID=M1A266_SOLTU